MVTLVLFVALAGVATYVFLVLTISWISHEKRAGIGITEIRAMEEVSRQLREAFNVGSSNDGELRYTTLDIPQWANSTGYTAGDVVKNIGSYYVCDSSHTSSASTEPDVGASWDTVWSLVAPWETSTDYSTSEVVYHNGDCYICISSHTSDSDTKPDKGATWGTVWSYVGTSDFIYYLYNSSDAYPQAFNQETYTLMHTTLTGVSGDDLTTGSFTFGSGRAIIDNVEPPPDSELSWDSTTLLATVHISIEQGDEKIGLKTEVKPRNEFEQ